MAKPKVPAHGQGETTPALPVQPAQSAASPLARVGAPSLLEYLPLPLGTEQWRVEKFEMFAIEVLPSDASQFRSWENEMARFHEVASVQTRAWLICRRLFGIGPMIPAADSHPDDLRASSRAEICASLGLAPDELQAELDMLRTLWAGHLKRELEVAPSASEVPGPTREPKDELNFGGEELLREFGFEEEMFKPLTWDPDTKMDVMRKAESNRIERDWFCGRLKQWQKMLKEQVAGALAREALMNELYLRRLSQEMSRVGPSTSKYKELYNLKKPIEINFQEQLSTLQVMFPEMGIAEKESFLRVISNLNKAHRDYYGNGSRVLIDKFMTASEIEVMLRMSVQQPEPRYRFGLNVAVVEAVHGLYDPNFRPQFKPAVLKKLDAGFKAAVVALREAQNEPLVDLEKGVLPGDGDDFEDLKEPGTEGK